MIIAGIGLQWLDFKASIEVYSMMFFALVILIAGIAEGIKAGLRTLKKWRGKK